MLRLEGGIQKSTILRWQLAGCLPYQKNGVVVRQVVGRDRLEGEHAARQLTELYRALRLYVNCFQPSMKLLAKECEGRKVRRIYDPAKTPLQRLLLSGVLPVSQQCELRAVARALDPLRLFQQLQHLQHAIFRCAVGCSLMGQASPLLVFASERCTTGLPLPKETEAVTAGSPLQHSCQESQEDTVMLTWRRTCKDPFVGQWEQILSWMRADPTRTSGDILRELQALFPGRYHPQQVRTLQRGMRKIRAHLLTRREEQWQQELIPTVQFQRQEPTAQQSPNPLLPTQPADSSLGTTRPPHPLAEAPLVSAERRAIRSTTPGSMSSGRKKTRPRRTSLPPVRCGSEIPDQGKDHRLTIELAITSYLAYHHRMGHEAKTLEWHQTALGQFRKYVQVERHLLHVCQITEADLRNWFVFLAQTPTRAGKHRAASTIETSARSVRAFCCWLVQRGDLPSSPMGEEEFPRTSVPFPHLIQPETFDRLVQATFPQDAAPRAKKMAARDRALLWVLFDTGISVSKVCALCVSDLDRKTGTLRVRGKGGKERQMVLGAPCLRYLLSALDQSCATQGTRAMRKKTGTDPLFCTERGRPLTKNSLALLFRRLRTRAGMDEIPISPKILRHSFALRYLQAGGNPQGLQELLAYEGTAPVRQYQRWSDQVLHDQMQKGTEEG